MQAIKSNESRLWEYVEFKGMARQQFDLIFGQILSEDDSDEGFSVDKVKDYLTMALCDALNIDVYTFEVECDAFHLEGWGQELESETVDLCQDVLGMRVGDIVLVESGKNTVRIEVEGMNVYSSDERVIFGVWGTRFRKDGLPGKRSEHIGVVVEND